MPAFGFVQFEFGFLLGPGDGRFIVRDEPDSEPERILVLTTLGAPQRRLLSGRRGRAVTEADPEPVPTSRATVTRAQPFADEPEAAAWLEGLRGDPDAANAELDGAMVVLNRALHSYRTAKGDPYARDVAAAGALVARIGYGSGEAVADGHFAEAWDLPRERRRTRRSLESPEERFAAILGGRERTLVGEELVLRARADLNSGRLREAALQARVALEALLAELPGDELAGRRAAVGEAANAALRGELDGPLAARLADAVAQREAELRRHRLSS